jgi:hypothetical protein
MSVREDLEKLLNEGFWESSYQEENGAIVKRVTQTEIFKAIKRLGKAHYTAGQFLLHLDDRITEQNGYKDELKGLQETVNKICTERDQTCPLLPLVTEIKTEFNGHLEERAKEMLIEETTDSLKQQWIEQGREDEAMRFKRIMGWIGAVATIVTVAMASITWFINLWNF